MMQLGNEKNETWFDTKEDYTYRNLLYQLVKNYEYPYYDSRVDAILLHPADFDKYRRETRFQYFVDNDIRFMGIPVYSVYHPTLKESEPMLLTNHNKKR